MRVEMKIQYIEKKFKPKSLERIETAMAFDSFVKEHFGEFTALNFP